jgi:hypothetical protein
VRREAGGNDNVDDVIMNSGSKLSRLHSSDFEGMELHGAIAML